MATGLLSRDQIFDAEHHVAVAPPNPICLRFYELSGGILLNTTNQRLRAHPFAGLSDMVDFLIIADGPCT